ncbi:MAG: UDP-3-O-(3-hydroxymyristoyl)glucosamine N-acyltransferase [Flavobacteriales bacterium CG_4_9_14_0_2_um_filter_35_242]|nr:UDP-3-O-(3-hydroxymyristoyl)glucosamine N-acyltransferase [Zetaproteobacteria bacterium]OIO13385.1 MAG: UDP-3-O-(3-hydroxymyristoyl)glucosamine N-acyltransferase [Flavobacteriaceae bacterium CG1_02_35_72]PIR12686.1 MAG: UDP-3-O-(3-hydroxymyristoyl)glucosamine N-acyltransferase [Flavobacteriales bacterium CG11_big_fil_rev_8_21_14_0_20_35_7]PIV16188.1 MAG: UDP-3-O-(3-hydroxymyristoyl)glucosamine N-acyltransferase [Flavobacteriales bacterium CG03_land_8_20_14_0_80_35_15]PIX06436.1 MAG: UDP-3-O-
MKFTATQISEILHGEIEGNPDVEVFKLSKIEESEEGSLTFLSNLKYTPYLYNTKATIAIVNKTFVLEKEINTTLIKVEDSYQAFSKLLAFYNNVKLDKKGIEEQSFIDKSAHLGQNLYLGSHSYIGANVKIGNNVKIFPNVFIGDNSHIGDSSILFSGVNIYSDTIIGTHCIIHSGVVIGSDGFGFAPSENGVYTSIPQIGNVIIEDHVDIGANTTIDRATLGSTIIRKGVKLDNQIQIAHNVEIGANTVIAAQTGIAGSTKIGSNCQIGGQVGFAGHLIIGNNVKIQAQSGIGRNLKDNEVVQGSPALPFSDFYKSYVHFKNLTKLVERINLLEKKLKI